MFAKPVNKPHRPKNNKKPTINDLCRYDGVAYAQTHECFGGNPRRQLSIKYGLQVKLCDTCHREITDNIRLDRVREIKEWGQRKFEAGHSREEFIQLFGRNYLD